ncbi:NAD(P)H-dependent oxidoreductase, partial [Streptomyces niveiscabiei]|uniref:NAD(P)H-dependent oxidoreductase n=2 Tax=Streptomyces TaxID=1883 RepID=UPI0030B831A3
VPPDRATSRTEPTASHGDLPMPNPASRTLVVLAHPRLSESRVNAALVHALREEENITVNDLYAWYPGFRIDVPHEQRLLLDHDHVVLQFPLYWYSMPALLKEWLDVVLTRGWAYGPGSSALHGKTLRLAISTGSTAEAYRPDGAHRHTIGDLLKPMEAWARPTGMKLAESLVVHGAGRGLDDETLTGHAKRYREVLTAA